MKWFEEAYGIRYVSLRYFNAAGANANGHIGEAHKVETHLIPLLLEVPMGKRDSFNVFGNDYPTIDGTCVRDYVHVTDLAIAHYKALGYLRLGRKSNIFNLGNGKGYSILDVVKAVRKVTGHTIPVEFKDKREGDPAILVASNQKAKFYLGWAPENSDIENIIKDAWNWHSKNPEGYRS